ncbi:MAG: subclass B3 metallo-beta-lactamase [Pedosphaera sp.]|nr:subclass B3 metallo-beta-lactamase [Pedosphaera sp.]
MVRLDCSGTELRSTFGNGSLTAKIGFRIGMEFDSGMKTENAKPKCFWRTELSHRSRFASELAVVAFQLPIAVALFCLPFAPFSYALAAAGVTDRAAGSPPNEDIRRPEVARRLFDSWKQPFKPFRIAGNIHYVGTAGVSSFLITTPEGHILIDTGFADTLPLVLTNITTLGHDWRRIKFLLASHAHVDHVGGHALLKEFTGATVCLSAADAALAARGGRNDYSPFAQEVMIYDPVKAGRIVRDGETISLDGASLTAHLTPGHTQGATTWTMRVLEDGQPMNVVFFSSLSLVEGTKLRDNKVFPGIVEAYRESLAKLKKLPCDIFLAPHGGAFVLAEKLARLQRGERPNPFIDHNALKEVIETTEKALATQLIISLPKN